MSTWVSKRAYSTNSKRLKSVVSKKFQVTLPVDPNSLVRVWYIEKNSVSSSESANQATTKIFEFLF